MPTFHDPTHDAAEASEALRGLAHATRTLDDPADTYAVIGSLLAGTRSLRQVIDQLATAHLNHLRLAHDDAGDHTAGIVAADSAADELHRAGTLLDAVVARLDAAFQHTGRIAWYPDPAPQHNAPSPARPPQSRSGRDGFGDPFTPSGSRADRGQGRPLSM